MNIIMYKILPIMSQEILVIFMPGCIFLTSLRLLVLELYTMIFSKRPKMWELLVIPIVHSLSEMGNKSSYQLYCFGNVPIFLVAYNICSYEFWQILLLGCLQLHFSCELLSCYSLHTTKCQMKSAQVFNIEINLPRAEGIPDIVNQCQWVNLG